MGIIEAEPIILLKRRKQAFLSRRKILTLGHGRFCILGRVKFTVEFTRLSNKILVCRGLAVGARNPLIFREVKAMAVTLCALARPDLADIEAIKVVRRTVIGLDRGRF